VLAAWSLAAYLIVLGLAGPTQASAVHPVDSSRQQHRRGVAVRRRLRMDLLSH
jgi:hypothetical protein